MNYNPQYITSRAMLDEASHGTLGLITEHDLNYYIVEAKKAHDTPCLILWLDNDKKPMGHSIVPTGEQAVYLGLESDTTRQFWGAIRNDWFDYCSTAPEVHVVNTVKWTAGI